MTPGPLQTCVLLRNRDFSSANEMFTPPEFIAYNYCFILMVCLLMMCFLLIKNKSNLSSLVKVIIN